MSFSPIISVEIPKDLAQHMLEQAKLGMPIRLSATDGEILTDAIKDAIAADDA